MTTQFICRRQSLIILIIIGSIMSLYIVVVNRLAENPLTSKRILDISNPEIIVDPDPPLETKMMQEDAEDAGIKVAPAVNGPKTIRRIVGTLDGIGCKLDVINPFSDDIMKIMHDFGNHKCRPSKDIVLNVSLDNVHLLGRGIDFVRTRQIIDDNKNGFAFEEYKYLIPPNKVFPIMKKGQSGAMRNDASNRCMMSGSFNPINPEEEIDMIYSSNCHIPEADFTYTKEGLLIHTSSKKCIGPKDNSPSPPMNTQLILSSKCNTKFDVINDGVLQMTGSGMCVHPMWGGDIPGEGQKLCLYPECEKQKRLTYHWLAKNADKDKEAIVTNKKFKTVAEMNHIEVQFLSEEVVSTYVLTVQPKPSLTPIKAVTPNIIVISIEEASAPHFQRKLPSTYKTMKDMGFAEYKYHAAISPTATVNLMTVLNGHTSNEGYMEGSVFRLAKKHNYITLFSADDPLNVAVGEGVTVDHTSLPLFRVLKQKFNIAAQSYCVTGQPIYDITLNYLTSFLNSYPSQAKLAVVLLSELTKVNFNLLGYMDKKFSSSLKLLNKLKNTIIFIQTLKGGENGKLGQILQGVKEIKRPLLATYVSKDIRDQYKFDASRLTTLSTSYDTHVTIRELISKVGQKHNYGKSLLRDFRTRNCLQAAIHPSMCPCV